MNADALLRNAVESGEVPGVAAAVTSRDGAVYEGAFGRRALGEAAAMSMDTVCWLASMTKPLVGVAAMQLVEQGRLELDAPAANVLPELASFQVMDGWSDEGELRLRPARRAMTLRHLLTHSSGFVYDTWNADMARYARAACRAPAPDRISLCASRSRSTRASAGNTASASTGRARWWRPRAACGSALT